MSETIIIIIGCALILLCMYNAFSEGIDAHFEEAKARKDLYRRIEKLENQKPDNRP